MAARISLGSGAAALGAALGGGGSLRQQAFNQRQRQLAQMFVDAARGHNLQADTALKQHRYDSQAGLGDAFAAAYGVSPEVGNALATIATSASTSNPEQIAGIGMRREAADTENPVAANRILSALAGKPNDLTKVSGGMAFNPNVLPEKNLFTPVEPLKSGYVFDPNTQTASPVPIVGAGEASGARTVPGADGHNVTFDFAPGTPQSVIDAAYAAAAANGDISAQSGAQPDFMAVPDPQGLLAAGNIDLSARPIVHNPDGSISTVRSITVTDDQGRAILIPTVVGNRVVSNQEAIDHYRKTGQNLGVFDNEADADAYAQQLHEQQAREYLPRSAAMPTGRTLADVTASNGHGDVVNKRAQEIRELKGRGVNMTPEQEQAYMLTGHVPSAMFGGDSKTDLSDDAAYYAAWNYNLTGKMPPFGMGGSSARTKVYNNAAKIAREAGVSPAEMRTVQGRQKALQVSLNNLRKQSDIMQKQMEAMHNNMDVAEQIVRQVNNGDIHSMNALKNAVKLHLGSEAVARLNVALNAVATDYGKIMSGATGAAGATEGELVQARKLMDPNMSPDQILGVFDVLRKDSEGQIRASDSRQSAIEDLMGQFGHDGSTPMAAEHGAPQQAATGQQEPVAPDVMRATNPQTGETVVWNGSAWVPER